MKLFKKSLSILMCFAFITLLFTANSFESEAKKKASTSKAKKNIVVVIDPGHDSTHIGCHYEGFEEENANLAIASYCIAELQKYESVTVYTTRCTYECPFGGDPDGKSKCLSSRVKFAKSLKADVLISLHNDFDGDLDVTQNGSKVIVPNASYRADLSAQGVALGQSILTQLTATGLNINNWKLNPTGTGIVTRDSGNGTYPDALRHC